MNSTNFKQYDTRWSYLPYPTSRWNIGNSGCGEVTIANLIIEMNKWLNDTPKTIQPYCVQYAAPNGDGTYWSGIPAMMKHYGMTEVKEHDTMQQLFKELAKGDRVAVYLMGSASAGSKGVHWTSGGHFVGSVLYEKRGSEDWVYMKDPNSTSSLRNGWMSYNGNIRGACLKVWSGKLSGAAPQPTPTPTGKLVVDGIGGYDTVKRLQEFLKLSNPDGLVSNQRRANEKWYPSLTAVSFGTSGGSNTVVALQKWLGLSGPDGIIGKNTTTALQKKLRDYGYLAKTESIDGVFGTKSMKALQTALNNDFKKKTDPTPPTPTPTKYTKVIDVSAFQDDINWKNVKADGIVGAMVRCGYRGYETGKLNEDSMFLKHIKGAYAAGLKVGVYFFTEAINAKEGKEEAEYTIKLIEKSGVNLYYPIAIDTEAQSAATERAKNLTKAQRTDAIKGFCEAIKANGGVPMIYASTSWFENKLDMSKLPYKIWCAQYYKECQYKGEVSMWQYTSEGSIAGVKGVVDMNKCYITSASPQPKPAPKPTPKKYDGKYPTYRLKKTNAKVKSDAVKWAKWIADYNKFHYGHGSDAHHNGCFFCGTQYLKKGHGIKEYEYTYCCNPFVGAAWAHGGGDATAYKMCHSCDSWDFGTGNGSYESSPLFDNLGHPAKSKLKAGDVLCNSHHVVLYLGNGKIAEAGHTDDNVINSSSWNSSIEVSSLTDSRYKDLPRAYRYNGKVDCDRIISRGEVSDRVKDLQNYLVWYGALPKGEEADGIYGDKTYKAVIKMQTDFFGAKEADGTVGPKTLKKMAEVVR